MKTYLVGIDEVGRGALAGPVCVGIFVIDQELLTDVIFHAPSEIRDSKKVSESKRNILADYFTRLKKEGVVEYQILSMTAQKVDEYGISVCIHNMIEKGLKNIVHSKESIIVKLDGGLHAPTEYIQETIIKGDDTEPVISCASIIAKVYRDTYMKKQSEVYPLYGFEKHVGYGTQAHRDAIKKNGLCMLHRKTFCRNSI